MTSVKTTAYRIMLLIAAVISFAFTLFNFFYYVNDIISIMSFGFAGTPAIIVLQLLATALLLIFALIKITDKNFKKVKTWAFIIVILSALINFAAAILTESVVRELIQEISDPWGMGYYYEYYVSFPELYIIAAVITVLSFISVFTLVRSKGVPAAQSYKQNSSVSITPLNQQQLTQEQLEERLLKAKKLLQAGAITKEEYDEMFSNIIEGKEPNALKAKSAEQQVIDEKIMKINKLKKMRADGLLTAEEYRNMLSHLF